MEDMKKDEFEIRFSEKFQRYFVRKKTDELTKNHRGAQQEDEPDAEHGYMIEDKARPEFCPVSSFRQYVSRLNPENPFMWQKPYDKWRGKDVWYTKQKLGVNSLRNFMKELSSEVGLSQIYTNHDIRATGISILSRAGFKDKDIMSCSGHRSTTSLNIYKKTNENDRLRCAQALQDAMFQQDEDVQGPTAILGNSRPGKFTPDIQPPSPESQRKLYESRRRYLEKRDHEEQLRKSLPTIPEYFSPDEQPARKKMKQIEPPSSTFQAEEDDDFNPNDPLYKLMMKEYRDDINRKLSRPVPTPTATVSRPPEIEEEDEYEESYTEQLSESAKKKNNENKLNYMTKGRKNLYPLRLLPTPKPAVVRIDAAKAKKMSFTPTQSSTSSSEDEVFRTPPSTPIITEVTDEEDQAHEEIPDDELLNIVRDIETGRFTMKKAPLVSAPNERAVALRNYDIQPCHTFSQPAVATSPPQNVNFARYQSRPVVKSSLFEGCSIGNVTFHVHKN